MTAAGAMHVLSFRSGRSNHDICRSRYHRKRPSTRSSVPSLLLWTCMSWSFRVWKPTVPVAMVPTGVAWHPDIGQIISFAARSKCLIRLRDAEWSVW